MTNEELAEIMDNSNFMIDSNNPYDMKILDALKKQVLMSPIKKEQNDSKELMTLNEAILHTEEKAQSLCGECAEEHKQLAEWLRELKASKNTIAQLVRERDAAIENIPKSCSKCAHSQDGYARVLADGKTDGFCLTCISNRRCNFKWRGVSK